MTKKTRATQWLLAAAVAALPSVLLPAFVRAQQQVQTDGRALDANNRIGSNGTNTYAAPNTIGVFGNQVINGNVSGGRAFHGTVGYSDPNEFRGFQAGRSTDNFIRDSASVGVPYSPPTMPNTSTPYYAQTRFAPPPAGYVPAGTSPGYIPAEPIVVQPNDARLGARLDAAPTGGVPRPGEMFLPGPVDPSSRQQTLLTGSPLTGIRQLNASDPNDLSYLNRFSGMRQDSPFDRLKLNGSDLQRMRGELGGLGVAGVKGSLNQTPSRAIGQPLEAPADAAIGASPLNPSIGASPFAGNISTDAGLYNRILGAPEKQSTQYDELKNRLERYKTEHKTTAEQAAGQFNATMHKKEVAIGKKSDETQIPGTFIPRDNNANTTPNVGNTNSKATTKPAPLNVKSMATGVKGAGLQEILAKAESLMKDGKYTSAIDQYAAAEQVAPNQPLVWIGRANAELGASYYSRAEAHLKQAFRSDEALLMAQYDLRSFLGEERLKSIVKDLQEIASTDQKSPTPVFLLAYISYNTGNESRAAGYLDMAEKRAGGKDPVYGLLREHWSLPAGKDATPDTKGTELNK